MKQIGKDSWFEMIPINAIGEEMVKNDNREVKIIQIEVTNVTNTEGIIMVLCELKNK